MLHYQIKDSTRQEMAREHRIVQIAISTIANESFGGGIKPKGIGKYQGGVCVNNREICIQKTNVMDDWQRTTAPTPEEFAVVEAIEKIADSIEKNGLDSIRHYANDQLHMADPLRSMFDLK